MQGSKVIFNIHHLLGSSSTSIDQICYAQNCLIYICGCNIVFYNPEIDQQVSYLKYHNDKISCISVTPDENYLAIAENTKFPLISVYNISNIDQNNPQLVWQLRGHKSPIDLLAISTNNKYLISVSNTDGSMFIWEKGQRISQNKMMKTVHKIAFDKQGDLYSIGRGHFKIWKFDQGNIIRKLEDQCWMIQGKSLTFGKKFATKQFVDIACEFNRIYALSSDGLLCIILKNEQKIQKWIDLMMQRTTSITIYKGIALCAGDNSIIKAIQLETLTLKTKFPKPPPNFKQNITQDQVLQYHDNELFPKCNGVKVGNQFIITLYQNRTIFIWKYQEQIRAIRSIISHQKKINSICLLQEIKGDICFFSTASQDKTIRIWHYYKKCFNNRQSIDIADLIGIKRNVYCKNLTRIIYTDAEQTIRKMTMFTKNYIACISEEQFLMYSLENFQLSAHLRCDLEILSLQTHKDLIYLGFSTGLIRIYKFNEQLIKVRQLQFKVKIQSIQICSDEHLIVYGCNQLIMYDLTKSTIIFTQKNIKTFTTLNNFILFCSNNQIRIYNIQKKKDVVINFQHELEQQKQEIKIIKSNSWIIVAITTQSKLLIANFSSIIIHVEKIYQQISDIQVAENGQIIMVSTSGTISIFQVISDGKFQKIQTHVKKWFQANDMSWLDGSVWASQNRLISERYPGAPTSQKIIQSFSKDQSIKIGEISIELPKIHPHAQINYKKQDNTMSVFNPSNIINQANKIYKDMSNRMKGQSEKSKPTTNQQSIQQIQLQLQSKPLPKKRIFGLNSKIPQKQQQTPAMLMGNLVTSTYHNNQIPLQQYYQKKYKIPLQQSLDSGFIQMQNVSFGELKQQQWNQNMVLMKNFQNLLQQPNFIEQNKEGLRRIYDILHNQFKCSEKEKQKVVIEKFKDLSKQFLSFLQSQY